MYILVRKPTPEGRGAAVCRASGRGLRLRRTAPPGPVHFWGGPMFEGKGRQHCFGALYAFVGQAGPLGQGGALGARSGAPGAKPPGAAG